MQVKINEILPFYDSRGKLISFPFDSLPFSVNRLFYVEPASGEMLRGGHAHKSNYQYLICLSGALVITVNNSIEELQFLLLPDNGALIENCTWSTQYYLTDTTRLLVLCSDRFDESDYLRSFVAFENYLYEKKEKEYEA